MMQRVKVTPWDLILEGKNNLLIPSELCRDSHIRLSKSKHNFLTWEKHSSSSNVWLWTTRLHSRQSCKWCLHQNTVNLHLYFSSFSVPSCGHVGVGDVDVDDILLCFWQTATFFTWEIIFVTWNSWLNTNVVKLYLSLPTDSFCTTYSLQKL